METNQQKASRLFLFQHHFVLGLAYHFAPFPELADDIANDVFMEFIENVSRWDLDSDIRPILVHLTKCAAIAHRRKQARECSENLLKIAEHVRLVAERNAETVNGEELFALRKCLRKLPQKSYRLIESRYYESKNPPKSRWSCR